MYGTAYKLDITYINIMSHMSQCGRVKRREKIYVIYNINI